MSIVRYISGTKLKNKFLAILFFVFLLSCLIIVVFARAVEQSYSQLLYEKSDQLLTYFSTSLENHMQGVEDVSSQIIADKMIQSDLAGLKENGQGNYNSAVVLRRISETLSSYTLFQTTITSMSIYTGELQAISGWDRPIAEDDQLEQLKERMTEAKGKVIWQITPDKEGVLCAREIKEIGKIDMSTLGYLVIHIDLPRIIRRDQLAFGVVGDNLNTEIMQGDTYIYPAAPTKFNQVQISNDRYNIVDVEGHKYFAVNRNSSYVDWNYRIFLDFDQVYDNNRAFIIGAIMMAVIIMALLTLLGGYLVVSQTVHFELLIKKINRFYQSDMQPTAQSPVYESRRDEIGVLHRSFDKMTREINDFVQENYLKTILLKDAQMQLLQEQVNPHFLFNTLNLINWLAKNGDSEVVTTVIEALARLLRSSLNDESATLSISDEMSLVDDYLYILKARYGERLVYSQNIDSDTWKVQIPKMSLQGLVENCINHAMENMTDACYICIESRINADRALVSVRDNGPGMDENILQMLRDKTVQPRGGGLGLVNIDNRIKLIYSEAFGVRIHSDANGSCVTLELPLNIETLIE